MDKRGKDRSKKRVIVRYGVQKADKTGFTKNLSPGGLFVQTNKVESPGTTIQLEIKFPDRVFSMWGRVAWAKRVPPQLAHILECGMGVQFVDPSDEWLEYVKKWMMVKSG